MINTVEKSNTFIKNANTVKQGALIKFIRHEKMRFGIVMDVREKTAIVIASSKKTMGMYFDAQKDTTIVNHANYEIVTLEPSKYITDLTVQFK